MSQSFVVTDDAESRRILGFYTVTNCQIAHEALGDQEAKHLPRHPIPAVMLARLAVDRTH